MEMISRVVYQLGLRKQITNKAEFVPEFQRYMWLWWLLMSWLMWLMML